MINAEVVAILGVGAMLLAAIVPAILYLGGRLDGINKRIDELGLSLNQRIDETNKRIDEQINQQAALREDMTGRMVRLEGKMDNLEGKMVRLEGRMDSLEGRMDNLEGKMVRLEGRMENLEGRMDRAEGMLEGLYDSAVKDRAA